MFVCVCNAVTDSQIIEELDNGASNMRDISRRLDVGRNCGQCCKTARQVIKQYHAENREMSDLSYAAI
ncbi:MAG: (2Fe-2S)-binding protein [Pseudomonadales bacterium]